MSQEGPDTVEVENPLGTIQEWINQSKENVAEWGIQEPDVLLLAIQEELGEVTQAYLEAVWEGGDPGRLEEELADLAPLLIQLQWSIHHHQWDSQEGEQ